MEGLTNNQYEQMRHALGLNYGNNVTRNNFYTNAVDAEWNDLVDKGLAVKRPGWEDDMSYFRVTKEGISHVKKFLGIGTTDRITQRSGGR